jgi:hypothetical protein
MADTSGDGTKFNTYTGKGDQKSSDLHIMNPHPDSGPRLTVGDANDLQDWLYVPNERERIGHCNQAENPRAGIFTAGQSQCVCIIVALFAGREDGAWSEAWLTHVNSDKDYSKIYGIIRKIDQNNFGRAYVAIGAKSRSKNWVETIGKAFDGVALPSKEVNARISIGGARGGGRQTKSTPAEQAEQTKNTPAEQTEQTKSAPAEQVEQPDPIHKPVRVWRYVGVEEEDFGFGIRADGIIGQVTGKLK